MPFALKPVTLGHSGEKKIIWRSWTYRTAFSSFQQPFVHLKFSDVLIFKLFSIYRKVDFDPKTLSFWNISISSISIAVETYFFSQRSGISSSNKVALPRTSHFLCLLFLWQFVISSIGRSGRLSVLARSRCPLFHSLGTKLMYSGLLLQCAKTAVPCFLFFSLFSALAKVKMRQTAAVGDLSSSFAPISSSLDHA